MVSPRVIGIRDAVLGWVYRISVCVNKTLLPQPVVVKSRVIRIIGSVSIVFTFILNMVDII